MKQGNAVTRIVIIVLFLAVLAYLGVYLWQGLSNPYQLVATYAFSMDKSVPLTGAVVRAEEPVSGWTPLAEVLCQEGERVSAGGTVALVYQDETALQNHRRAQSLEMELERIRYAMRLGDSTQDAAALDARLVDTLSQLRADASAGDLDRLEQQGAEVRDLVVKRTTQAASGSADLSRLQSDAEAIERELAGLGTASGTRRVTVSRSGLFSGVVDGYEETLTPASLDGLTAASLDELCRQDAIPLADRLGKLITGSTWYLAANIPTDEAKSLETGKSYLLAFNGDFDQEVSMTLERLGGEEDGRRLAVFSSDRYLNRATMARFVSASLVFERQSGVRIPDRALRVKTNDDGTTTPGVYAMVGRRVEFKAVEILREGEGFYLVRGTDTNRKVLRPGDTVVLSNRALYDGKVVA